MQTGIVIIHVVKRQLAGTKRPGQCKNRHSKPIGNGQRIILDGSIGKMVGDTGVDRTIPRRARKDNPFKATGVVRVSVPLVYPS